MNFKSIISRIFLVFFTFSIVTLLLCFFSKRTAYILNFSIAFYLRRFFASLCSLFDFSLFEILVIASPLLILSAIFYINRAKRGQDVKRRFILIISIFSLLPSSYVFMIAIPNLSPYPFCQDASLLDDGDYIRAAKILAEGVNELSERSGVELSYGFLSDALTEAYSPVFAKLELPYSALPLGKPIRFSKALSYIGALALYSSPTGEININTEIPTYMIPFTVAHEYAHYLGVGGEGDANLLAFISCESVEDAAVRYSARLTMLEYVLSDLYKIDRETYTNIYNALDIRVKEDIKEHIAYAKKYESSYILRFFDGLNSLHGAVWDSDGKSSYSATAGKIAVYFKNNQKPKI